MAGYIGSVPVPQATETRDVYTATSNQTSFTTGGYTPNFVSVYLNGVHLAQADYTATNGSDVVLASGATADDTVEIVSFGTFKVADVLPISGGTMTGDLIIPDGDLVLGSTAVTATAAEINLIKGATARGTTAVADGDGFLTNDGGTMRMTKVDTLATYMGTKITGGSLVFIASTGAISNAASVQFRAQDGHFDETKYDHYQFWLQNVIPATDAVSLIAQTSTNDGGAYSTTNGDYHNTDGADDSIGIQLSNLSLGSAANEFGINGMFNLFAPHNDAAYTSGLGTTVSGASNGNYYARNVGGTRLAAENVDAIRFIMSSGNIESGEIVMYGIANGT